MVKPQKEENRLARFINKEGGLRREDALLRAQDSLYMIQERANAEIDSALDRIGAMLERRGVITEKDQQELHAMANTILSLGGMFNREALGRAAFSLCELIDELGARGAWDSAAIRVHYEAMCALKGPETKQHQEAVLAGLQRVTERHAAPH